jgi:hypothetical protein
VIKASRGIFGEAKQRTGRVRTVSTPAAAILGHPSGVSPQPAGPSATSMTMKRSAWRTWSAMQSKNFKLKTRGLLCCCTVVEVVMPVFFFALMCLPKVRVKRRGTTPPALNLHRNGPRA